MVNRKVFFGVFSSLQVFLEPYILHVYIKKSGKCVGLVQSGSHPHLNENIIVLAII
jgi:hypothetical protein